MMVFTLLAGAAVLLLLLVGIGKVPLSYNLRNLTVRWKTTVMTALAFTAVIALLTVMMAFVHGMRRMTEQTGQPGNVLVLSDGATDEILSNLTIGDLSEIENQAGVLHVGGRPMASRETYLIATQPVSNNSGDRTARRYLQVRGVEDPQLTAAVHGLNLLSGGTWFSEAGVQEAVANARSAAKENKDAGTGGLAATVTTARPGTAAPLIQAVLGEGVARELARGRTAKELAVARNRERLDVGDTFCLRDRTWIVVGILNSGGMTFNSEIWAKRSLVASLFGKDTYTTLVLRTQDAEAAAKLKDFLKDYKKAAVSPHVETDYYKSLSETSAQFSWAIGFLAVVMSIGGIFGVMNTMFAAVSQRIGDIGVLRILGYARWQILISFLLESLAIALIGGLLGCALGFLSDGWTATSIVGGNGGGKSVVLQLSVDADVIATGILLTLTMGLLGGLLPALAAMRLKPLEAMK